MVYMLFQVYNTPSQITLDQAAYRGDLAGVRRLLRQGVDVDSREGDNHKTPLMCAASSGKVEVIQELLRHHAAVNATSVRGDTALISASLNGHTDIVKMLIDAGADVHVVSQSGYTALRRARQRNHTACAALLEAALATGQGNALFSFSFGFISK